MTTQHAARSSHSTSTWSSVPTAVASIRSIRSLLSRIISAWHSGSPNRQLYSSTFGPPGVSISPA
jgi:hypothetical protein